MDADGHPFCACCLFTQNMAAFGPQVGGQGTFGIRLLAARLGDGTVAADCRVNGAEYEPGKAALRRYARTWPGREPVTRKQYVVVRPA